MYTVRKSVFANTRAQLFSELQVLNFSLLDLQDLKTEFFSTVSPQKFPEKIGELKVARNPENDSDFLANIIAGEDEKRLRLITKVMLRYFEEDGYLPSETDFEGQGINCFQYKFLVSLFKAIKSRNPVEGDGFDAKFVTITRENL